MTQMHRRQWSPRGCIPQGYSGAHGAQQAKEPAAECHPTRRYMLQEREVAPEPASQLKEAQTPGRAWTPSTHWTLSPFKKRHGGPVWNHVSEQLETIWKLQRRHMAKQWLPRAEEGMRPAEDDHLDDSLEYLKAANDFLEPEEDMEMREQAGESH
ncbi:Condensin-2 complex subunit H2 [Fukomys damarensis]|uniref:Condensin-2 complex subunit H2 n=1 Tax=Fukomys damarensis TaxID=885580 RepID=A0A091E6N5_FUKDA|nr:Condensin-2 complex subunit H2 [Fukomys damarensis]